eukprot:2098799-Prymnesium_polylepis.1
MSAMREPGMAMSTGRWPGRLGPSGLAGAVGWQPTLQSSRTILKSPRVTAQCRSVCPLPSRSWASAPVRIASFACRQKPASDGGAKL